MTIESPCIYINQLNSSYPEGGADRSTADDHLRLIKATVLATFPAVTGPVTVTHTELNLLSGASSTLASISALTTKFSLSISAINTRVNTLSASVSLVQADVARISQTVSVVIADVARLSLSVSAVVTDMARISLSVSAVVTDMARISLSVSAINTRVNTLSASVSLVQADVARISVTVSAIWTRINTLSASVSLIQATILGGVYTPTITGKTNVSGVGAITEHKYLRIGAQVIVYGRVALTATGAGTIEAYVELPVASNLGVLLGVAQASFVVGPVYADDVGERAVVSSSAAGAGALNLYYSFAYTIA